MRINRLNSSSRNSVSHQPSPIHPLFSCLSPLLYICACWTAMCLITCVKKKKVCWWKIRCFRNSAYTEFRKFFKIPFIPYSIQNCPEFRRIPYYGIRQIPRNSVTFSVTKFRITLFFYFHSLQKLFHNIFSPVLLILYHKKSKRPM